MKGWSALTIWAGIGVVPTLSGCSRQTVHGDSTTYGHGWLPIGVIFIVMVALVVIGVGMAVENRQKVAKQSRRKKKKPGPQEEVGVGGLIAGSLLAIGGTFGLLLVVPSMLLSYVTVSPDKVVIRDSLLWFTGSPREIPYSDTRSMSLAVEETFSRRGRREKHLLTINRITGHGETIEMNGMHKAAWPDWESKFRAFTGEDRTSMFVSDTDHSTNEKALPSANPLEMSPFVDDPLAENSQRIEATAPFSSEDFGGADTSATASGSRQIIPQLGFARPGAAVKAVRQGGMFEDATVVEVYSDHRVKVAINKSQEIEILEFGKLIPANMSAAPSNGAPFPPPTIPKTPAGEVAVSKSLNEIGEFVRTGEKVSIGDVLYKEYAGRWSQVTIQRVDSGSKVRIHWVGWDETWDEDVELATLRKPK